MKDTAFHPPAEWQPRIAPTEMLGSGMLRGVVHDGNARLAGRRGRPRGAVLHRR